MARDKVGVQMSLDDVADPAAIAGCRFEVDVDIALGIDDDCDAVRRDHIRCVGQATKTKSLDLRRFHSSSCVGAG
jgi:hypothetical protein